MAVPPELISLRVDLFREWGAVVVEVWRRSRASRWWIAGPHKTVLDMKGHLNWGSGVVFGAGVS